MVEMILHVRHLNPHSLTAFREEMVEMDFPDPSHLEACLSEDWVKGKGIHTIKHISQRSPPPQGRQDLSIYTVKVKNLEFPNVLTSVQIIDLDWNMIPTAIGLYLSVTIKRSEMCQTPPQTDAVQGCMHTARHTHYSNTNTLISRVTVIPAFHALLLLGSLRNN